MLFSLYNNNKKKSKPVQFSDILRIQTHKGNVVISRKFQMSLATYTRIQKQFALRCEIKTKLDNFILLFFSLVLPNTHVNHRGQAPPAVDAVIKWKLQQHPFALKLALSHNTLVYSIVKDDPQSHFRVCFQSAATRNIHLDNNKAPRR